MDGLLDIWENNLGEYVGVGMGVGVGTSSLTAKINANLRSLWKSCACLLGLCRDQKQDHQPPDLCRSDRTPAARICWGCCSSEALGLVYHA